MLGEMVVCQYNRLFLFLRFI